MTTSSTLPTLGAEHPKPHLYLPIHERIARKHRRSLVPAPLQSKVQISAEKPKQQR